MKEFIFLYPIPEYINFEIEKNYGYEEFATDMFREKYESTLNQCIDIRYRQKGFGINYAIFNGSSVSEVILIQDSDKILEVGLDFKTHTTKQQNGEYLYPNPDYILNQLNGVTVIRIAGFHAGDCVDKLAKRAFEKGLNTLVDEDLTEYFSGCLKDPNFDTTKYPNFNPRKYRKLGFELFMEARKEKPWLWQDY